MTKMLSAAVALIAALALAPASFGAVCADCEPGGGGGGGGGGTNSAPTAGFGFAPTVPQIGTTVQFTNSSSDSDGSVTGYSWSFGDGRTSTAAAPAISYGASGTYTVTLTVTDNDGAASQPVSQQIRVNALPTATILVDATTVEEDTAVSFNSLASDPDGFIAHSSWNFGGPTANGAVATYTWTEPGEYNVSFSVTDNDGAMFTQNQVITVTPHPAPGPDPDTGGGDPGAGGGSASGGDNTGGGSATGGGSTTGGDSATAGGSTTGGVAGTGGGQEGSPTENGADKKAPALVVPAKLKAKKKAGKLVYAVTTDEAATVVAKLKGKVAGSATVKIAKAGKGRIVIKLSSKAKKMLKAARSVKLTLVTTATDAAGNSTAKITKVTLA